MTVRDAFDKAARIEIFTATNQTDVVIVFFRADSDERRPLYHVAFATAIFDSDSFDQLLIFMIQFYPDLMRVDKR